MDSKIGSHKTQVYIDPSGYVEVRLHGTCVVWFDERYVVLDTGGFRTPLTKRRMNEVSEEFGLGFHVYQRDFKWYVEFKDGDKAYITKEFMWDTEGFRRV